MIDIPDRYQEKYGWIAKEFDKIPGVEIVKFDGGPNHLHLIASNRSTGGNLKMFRFQLKERILLELLSAPDEFFDYDIMDIQKPEIVVAIGIIKANRLFNDKYKPTQGNVRSN